MRPTACGLPARSVTVPRTVPLNAIGPDTWSPPPHATARPVAEIPATAMPLPHTEINSRRVRRVTTRASARLSRQDVMPICSTDARTLPAADLDVRIVDGFCDRQRQLG